ncbi:hypothetical protein BH11PAT2_BH11PAT2_02610 [soil metagenome]
MTADTSSTTPPMNENTQSVMVGGALMTPNLDIVDNVSHASNNDGRCGRTGSRAR